MSNNEDVYKYKQELKAFLGAQISHWRHKLEEAEQEGQENAKRVYMARIDELQKVIEWVYEVENWEPWQRKVNLR